MSARCAFNCANWAWRCVYCLFLLMVEVERELETWRGVVDVERVVVVVGLFAEEGRAEW